METTYNVIMSLITASVVLLCVFSVKADPGEPLILTPLIESGNIDEAKSLSKVGLLSEDVNVESYSGYFTVDKEYDSNIFFWYFPAEVNATSAPVLLWLQGGPGASSMMALFTENGPYVVNENYNLEKRDIYWSQKYNVIYMDNPVGTGYSYTSSIGGYSRDQTSIANNLYSALVQFFTVFPELQQNPFFITGESYAGKYVPTLGYTVHTKNPDADLKINLQGVAIGNGLCDPPNMLLYGDYLYQLGLIDTNARDYFHEQEAKVAQLISEENWLSAVVVWNSLINNTMTASTFFNLTGFTYEYNYLHADNDPVDNIRYAKFVEQDDVRAALHVGNNTYEVSSTTVLMTLVQDILKSARPMVESLLENYRVLIYNGQLDIIAAYPLTVNFLKHLEWSAADEYKLAERYQWKVDGQIAGYVKTAGNLTEIMVRNAGHLVPGSQPSWAMDLIERFVENMPYH